MNRTRLRVGALAAIAVGLMFLGACQPEDMPAYTNGGKTVVAVTKDPSGILALWTYDVESRKVALHPLPDKGNLKSARMLGDQVWVEYLLPADPPGPGGGKNMPKGPYHKRFDPASSEFVPAANLGGESLIKAIPASYEGRKCLFLPGSPRPSDAGGKIIYNIYPFPELNKRDNADLDQVFPAGRFWWITLRTKEARDGKAGAREIANVDLFNAEGKKVAGIPNEEGRKMKYVSTQFMPGYARLSDDDAVLLLAFGGQGHYNFGVFDTATGKFLWGGQATHNLTGNPLVRKTEVWSLEWPETGQLALIRHTPGQDGGEGRREAVLKLPINTSASNDQFTPSPDGSHFVLTATGAKDKPPQLLFIPIKEGVTEKDVRSVELKAAE